MTVGVGTVMDAKEVIIIITGYIKARALKEVGAGFNLRNSPSEKNAP